MGYMNYMKDQQTFLDNTIMKIKGRPNPKMLIAGPTIITYEFINEPSKTVYKGTIFFDGGEQREVRIIKSEKTIAKRLFHATSNLENEAILQLYFATYCEEIDNWILCYDQFHYLLGDWLVKQNIPKKMRVGDDLLHFDGCNLIRSVLEGIIYVHTKGLIHTGLHLTSSYVVLSNKVKIINVGMQSLEDVPTPVDDATLNGLRMKDLMEFKDLLKTHILQPGAAWSDRDLFFSFFDLTTLVRYNIFVDKLMKHSFLMKNAEERMCSFYKIEQCTRDQSIEMRTELENTLESESFEQYLNWDDTMGDHLRSVYEYEDENVPRRYYDGQSVMHLLELLRNAYRHPGQNSLSELDEDVRTAYSGFLHRAHKAFCRVHQQDDGSCAGRPSISKTT